MHEPNEDLSTSYIKFTPLNGHEPNQDLGMSYISWFWVRGGWGVGGG